MTQDELLQTYESVSQALDEAPNDPTPFPVIKDDKIHVVGDANETQINKRDFKIEFHFPEGLFEGEGDVNKTVEYKNVFITPRQSGKVVASLCRMMPFFRQINGKDIEHYSADEMVVLLGEYGHKFIDDMYDLVATVLNIDPALVDYMDVTSVMAATEKIFRDYPETINEAEAFFS